MTDEERDRLESARERFAGSQTGLIEKADGTFIVPEGTTLEREQAVIAAHDLFWKTGDKSQLVALGIF